MKKIIIAIALMFAFSTVAFAEFDDMSGCDEEMRAAVAFLNERNYISGKSETEFAPSSAISRAEIAAVILRMTGEMGENRPYYLSDVPKKVWYYYVAGSATEHGLMSGFEDKTFRGEETVNKAQAITLAAKLLQNKAGANGDGCVIEYTDAVPEWAEEYVKIAVKEGIIAGSGTFGADNPITRGEAAVMLKRVYDKIKDAIPAEAYSGDYERRTPPITVVLDAGHGGSTYDMSDEEKIAEGWIWNEDKGQWGEWRHWKNDTVWQDCYGSGCSFRGDCWYRMGNSDRETEPEINLANVRSAEKYLLEKGYDVRLTRTDNVSHPSITNRLIYCYPNNDISAFPDADLFVCIHSNAGGGRGSAYIELSGDYRRVGGSGEYVNTGNTLGKYINDKIVSSTSLGEYCGGKISGLNELILFCKSPVPASYLEIGFFDNGSDLAILQSEYDAIGKAIADGIDSYCRDAGV